MTEQDWVRNSDLTNLTVNAVEVCFSPKIKQQMGDGVGCGLLFALGRFPRAPDCLSVTRKCLQRVLGLVCRSVSWEIEAEAPCRSILVASWYLASRRCSKRPWL